MSNENLRINSQKRGVYALNANGSCKQRLIDIFPNLPSFCEQRDPAYFFDPYAKPPMIYGYSIESGIIQEYELRKPKFPRYTNISRAMRDAKSPALIKISLHLHHKSVSNDSYNTDGIRNPPEKDSMIMMGKSYNN